MIESVPYFIRLATRSDESFLWEMLYQAIYIAPGSEPLPKEIVRDAALSRYVSGWGRPDDLGFIATVSESQQPIGAAWSRLLTGDHQGYGYVDDLTPELSIALTPNWRGQGVGTRLLQHLLEAASSRYLAISLSVSSDNPARSLYERLGFAIVGVSESTLTMKKRFNG